MTFMIPNFPLRFWIRRYFQISLVSFLKFKFYPLSFSVKWHWEVISSGFAWLTDFCYFLSFYLKCIRLYKGKWCKKMDIRYELTGITQAFFIDLLQVVFPHVIENQIDASNISFLSTLNSPYLRKSIYSWVPNKHPGY